VLTLCGNHDLYCGAEPFLSLIKTLRQPGRYFAIETPGWRIVCLDTSLASYSLLRGDGRLDDRQLEWLRGLLNIRDGRATVLLSHHFIRSAWGKGSPILHHQLSEDVKNKVFSWYWGHEHGCAAYKQDGFGFYGACIGNGAFFKKWEPPRPELSQPAWYAKGRCECGGKDGPHFWQHGFLELELLPQKRLLERFHLENGETFERRLPE